MGTGAAALAVACVVLGSPRTQDDLPRQRLFGVALRADRSPWAGARVHACAAGPWTFAIGEPDQVTALSDQRGRFHVDVLGGRRYSVWAEQALDDGTVLVSTDVRDGWAGERVELEAAATAVAAPELVLRELPSGIALPLRVVVRSAATGLVERFEVGVRDDGTAAQTLAASPRGNREVIVTDAAGRLVLAAVASDPDVLTLRPAPARWLRAKVEDLDANAGIAGAGILAIVGGRRFELGSTDATGVAVFDAAPLGARIGEAQRFWLGERVVAAAPGFGFARLDHADVVKHPTREDALAAADPDQTVRPLRPGTPPRRLRLRIGETALTGAHALMRSGVAHRTTDQRSVNTSVVELCLVTDAGGLLDLPAHTFPLRSIAGTPVPSDFTLVVDRELTSRLPASWRERMPAAVKMDIPLPANAGGAEIIDLDLLRALRPIDLHFVAPDGASPAAGIDVRCGSSSVDREAMVRSDRTGRVRVLVPIRSRGAYVVAAMEEVGWCARQLDPGSPVAVSTDVARMTVQLEEPLRIAVSVLPGNAPRLPDDIHVSYTQAPFLGRAGRAVPAPAPAATPVLIPLEPRQQFLLLRGLEARRRFPGSRITIGVPAIPSELTLTALGTLDGKFVKATGSFSVTGDEGTIEFELAFDK